MDWEWLISASIIIGLILAIWARMTRQSIGEVLTGIKDFIIETKEGVQDTGEGITIYE